MNHPFNKSSTNPAICSICAFDFLSHTHAAKCDLCSRIGEVHIHDTLRKCSSCIADYEIGKNELLLDADTFLRLVRSEEDASIRYSGDVFNDKKIANHKVKDEIFKDDSLSDEAKHQKYFSFLADRYTHFQQVIFEHSSIAHDGNVEVIVISNELREFGDKVREETRNRIKQADEFYAPAIINKPITPKVVKKKSAMEKMIEALMQMRSCSETEARLLIEQGNFNKKTE